MASSTSGASVSIGYHVTEKPLEGIGDVGPAQGICGTFHQPRRPCAGQGDHQVGGQPTEMIPNPKYDT